MMIINRANVVVLTVAGTFFAGGMALATEHGHAAGKADKTEKAEKAEKSVDATAAKPAADKAAAPAPGEVVLKGEMTCAKCGLHEADKCQNVLRVKAATGDKETKYYLAKNAVSDGGHKKVCSANAPATVTGKVSDEGGKKVLAASTIKYE